MPKVQGKGPLVDVLFSRTTTKESIPVPELKQTSVLVLASPGDEYSDGEYLAAIIKQALLCHSKVTVLIADSVDRHNLAAHPLNPRIPLAARATEAAMRLRENAGRLRREAIIRGNQLRESAGQQHVLKTKIPLLAAGVTEAIRLRQEAIILGNQFITRNMGCFLSPIGFNNVEEFQQQHPSLSIDEQLAIINQIAIQQDRNLEIIRWQDWVSKPEYQGSIREKLEDYYRTHETLVSKMRKLADSYARRHKDKQTDEAVLFRCYCNYLTEKSPAVIWLAAKLGYRYIVSPSAMLPVFKATKDLFFHQSTAPKTSLPPELEIQSDQTPIEWLDVHFTRSHQSVLSNLPDLKTLVERYQPLFFRSMEQGNPGNTDALTPSLLEPVEQLISELLTGNEPEDQPAAFELLIETLTAFSKLAAATQPAAAAEGPSSPPATMDADTEAAEAAAEPAPTSFSASGGFG